MHISIENLYLVATYTVEAVLVTRNPKHILTWQLSITSLKIPHSEFLFWQDRNFDISKYDFVLNRNKNPQDWNFLRNAEIF